MVRGLLQMRDGRPIRDTARNASGIRNSLATLFMKEKDNAECHY